MNDFKIDDKKLVDFCLMAIMPFIIMDVMRSVERNKELAKRLGISYDELILNLDAQDISINQKGSD